MNRLLETLHSGAQGASNSAAGIVSGPVDTLASILRKMGIPVPSDPVAGDQWMRRMGLVQEPKNKIAEGIGMAIPALPAGRVAK